MMDLSHVTHDLMNRVANLERVARIHEELIQNLRDRLIKLETIDDEKADITNKTR